MDNSLSLWRRNKKKLEYLGTESTNILQIYPLSILSNINVRILKILYVYTKTYPQQGKISQNMRPRVPTTQSPLLIQPHNLRPFPTAYFYLPPTVKTLVSNNINTIKHVFNSAIWSTYQIISRIATSIPLKKQTPSLLKRIQDLFTSLSPLH